MIDCSLPLVSILIPTFNSENYIEQCLESALRQTYGNIEIVINDNNSKDKTNEIVGRYLSKNKNIHLGINSENLGPVFNWKRCVQQARGEYALLLFSDDMLEPECIEKLLEMMMLDKLAFVFSSVNHFEDYGSKKFKKIVYDIGETGKYNSKIFLDGHLISNDDKFPQSPACALFRTYDLLNSLQSPYEDYLKMGYEKHGAGPDLKIFFDVLIKYENFGFIKIPLVNFRSHVNNLSKKKEINIAYAISKSQYLGRIFKLFSQKELKRIRAEQFYLLMRLKRLDLYDKAMMWDGQKYKIDYMLLVSKILNKLKRKILS